jgi:hypothetical protein
MRPSNFNNVNQQVTDYDAINVYKVKQSDLRGLKYERRSRSQQGGYEAEGELMICIV